MAWLTLGNPGYTLEEGQELILDCGRMAALDLEPQLGELSDPFLAASRQLNVAWSAAVQGNANEAKILAQQARAIYNFANEQVRKNKPGLGRSSDYSNLVRCFSGAFAVADQKIAGAGKKSYVPMDVWLDVGRQIKTSAEEFGCPPGYRRTTEGCVSIKPVGMSSTGKALLGVAAVSAIAGVVLLLSQRDRR